MESVKDLTGNEFKKEGNTTLKEKVMSFFNRLGNKVHSQRFGDVDLTLSSFRSEAAHGWTRGKIISFEAIPEVIQNGVVIDSQRRGNGNYDRIVVAAPITIAGQEYYMGAMLQRDNKSQRLYLHDVITKEKASIHESEHLSSNRVADETDSLFMTSILQKAVLVNSKSTQDSEEIFSAGQKSKKVSTRQELHNSIVNDIKTKFADEGFDFDEVLSKAKDLSTFSTVDNTPQRVMEKSLGYMEGQILADETVNKVALNETEGIKWLNNYIDEIIAISKEYGIKPGSKASAAAQMYAEGFYVAKNGDIIEYGDKELELDFPDTKTREK